MHLSWFGDSQSQSVISFVMIFGVSKLLCVLFFGCVLICWHKESQWFEQNTVPLQILPLPSNCQTLQKKTFVFIYTLTFTCWYLGVKWDSLTQIFFWKLICYCVKIYYYRGIFNQNDALVYYSRNIIGQFVKVIQCNIKCTLELMS